MAKLKDDGKATLATRAIADSPAPFTAMACSENTDAEVSTGTTLTDEITDSGLERAAATCTNPSPFVTQWVKTWIATGTKNIRKVAIFNALNGGNILMEHLYPVVKGVGPGESFTGAVQMITSGE